MILCCSKLSLAYFVISLPQISMQTDTHTSIPDRTAAPRMGKGIGLSGQGQLQL